MPGGSDVTVKRRLVFCCDGTSNDGINSKEPQTNVYRLFRCVKDGDNRFKGQPVVQLPHYHAGVGTGTSWVTNKIDGFSGRGKFLFPEGRLVVVAFSILTVPTQSTLSLIYCSPLEL